MRKYGNRRSWSKFLFYAIAGLFYAAVRERIRGHLMGVVGKALGIYDGLLGKEDRARELLKRPWKNIGG